MWKSSESKLRVATVFVLLGVLLYSFLSNRNYSMVAESVVTGLYTYRTDEAYAVQMARIKKCVSDEVYLQLTTDEDYTNRKYILWKKDFTDVRIVKSTSSYVVYALEASTYDSNRRFVFFYDTDLFGRIVGVRECELSDFIKYSEDTG